MTLQDPSPDPVGLAYLFRRRAGAAGLGHLAWAISDPDPRAGIVAYCGATEEAPRAPSGDDARPNFWLRQCVDFGQVFEWMRCNPENERPYDDFKRFVVVRPRVEAALAAAGRRRSVMRLFTTSIGLEAVHRILSAYGVRLAPRPIAHWSANHFFEAIDLAAAPLPPANPRSGVRMLCAGVTNAVAASSSATAGGDGGTLVR